MSGSTVAGLTSAEVQARRQNGQGNDVKLATSRSYRDIVKTNVFNPINLVLYAIGIGMILVGDFRSAIATVMLVVFNAVVGVVQEVLAKRKLDNIALLARAKVTVRRDGQDQQVLRLQPHRGGRHRMHRAPRHVGAGCCRGCGGGAVHGVNRRSGLVAATGLKCVIWRTLW